IVFYVGLLVFSALLVFRLVKLSKLINSNPKQENNNFTLVTIKNENEVFSWFNYVFAHKDKLSDETISHELVHIKNKHSIDILFLEIVQVILWFSPVVRWYKHELQLVHEYQADANATKESVTSYAKLLVNELFQVNELSMVHNFWKVNQIKNRIKMLKKMKTQKIKSLKYLLVLPLLAMFTLQYSCSRDTENSSEINELKNADEMVFNFNTVDVQPQVIGVDESLSKQEKYIAFQKAIMKHVKDNFHYPEQAIKDTVQGRVVTSFIFGTDGKVKDVKILKGVNEELDAEALRLASSMPDVTPAYQDGKAVPVSFMLPITFKLVEKDKTDDTIKK
ncbi:MAG: TonB family protein, partial [Flavobacteriales bacterium]|nr:TonB family protein [Flavobacteriales bacterium]